MTDNACLFVLAQGGGGSHLLFGLVLMLVVFYAIVLTGNRKEKRKRQDMLASLKKNDRVMTIGGIIGSVVSVTDNEVSLKVDESNNVKITVIRSAIQRVLQEDEKPSQ
ncbi:MAG TPA: preprotein translocase subunit YajC [Phycisphaerae bacterium]|nr:preprotein translocase subunit YajC [Phycisphaerae bacterium]